MSDVLRAPQRILRFVEALLLVEVDPEPREQRHQSRIELTPGALHRFDCITRALLTL